MRPAILAVFSAVALASAAQADVGDPQIKTDHPWYPGELAFSTFDRLFATRVTFDWIEDSGAHRESRVFPAGTPAPWELTTGANVVTRWVEYEAVKAP